MAGGSPAASWKNPGRITLNRRVPVQNREIAL